MDLDGIPEPRRSVVDTADHTRVGVSLPFYAGVAYRGPATQSIRFTRVVASERTLRIGVRDWDIGNVMDYVHQREHYDSCRFGVFWLMAVLVASLWMGRAV